MQSAICASKKAEAIRAVHSRAEKEKCYEETFSLMSKVSQQAHTSVKKKDCCPIGHR